MDNRRQFIQKNIAVMIGAPVINNLKQYSSNYGVIPKMDCFATNWGFQGDMMAFCGEAKKAGYDGIEVWAPLEEKDQDLLKAAVDKFELKLGLLTGNSGADFEQHLESFERSLNRAVSLKPQFINCHSGKDHFSTDQNVAFIEMAFDKEAQSGIPIYHETHRGRMMFSTTGAENFLKKYANLKFTLDISHWCCVHESLLADQEDRVDLVLNRTKHVHARIGFQEGPQIPDPRDDQYKSAIQAHFTWWDKVVTMLAENNETITMTAEFGPPGYMWTLPYTKAPVANNWDINLAMLQIWKDRYTK